MLELIFAGIFTPLWPMGLIFSAIATTLLYRNRRKMIFFVPFISASIWGLVRVITMWDFLFAHDERITQGL
jgi:hypothetical protein